MNKEGLKQTNASLRRLPKRQWKYYVNSRVNQKIEKSWDIVDEEGKRAYGATHVNLGRTSFNLSQASRASFQQQD